MKRLLLITCILVTVFLAGVLQGSYSRHEKADNSSLDKVYSNHYPATVPTITLLPVNYCLM